VQASAASMTQLGASRFETGLGLIAFTRDDSGRPDATRLKFAVLAHHDRNEVICLEGSLHDPLAGKRWSFGGR
jgi:hypothetical protein